MEATVSGPEKAFIAFLINYIVDTNPNYLFTNVADVSKHIQDSFDARHELNLYRKSFGNLKQCVQSEHTAKVVILEGLRFNFVAHDKMEEAKASGIIDEETWAKYLTGKEACDKHRAEMEAMKK